MERQIIQMIADAIPDLKSLGLFGAGGAITTIGWFINRNYQKKKQHAELKTMAADDNLKDAQAQAELAKSEKDKFDTMYRIVEFSERKIESLIEMHELVMLDNEELRVQNVKLMEKNRELIQESQRHIEEGRKCRETLEKLKQDLENR